MSKYFHLTVKEIIEETHDTKTFSFWQPIHQSVTYKAGQFITVIPEIDGKKVRRSYSMSSSPREGSLAITVKRVHNGLVSNYLCDNIKVGDAIEVMEPLGNFIAEPISNARNIVMFSGGSGITPLLSIIKTILPSELNTKIYLIYGSRDEENIIFKNQFDLLEQEYIDRFKVIHVLTKPSYTWTGYKTRINQASAVIFLKQEIGLDIKESEYFLCGPNGMMEQVISALQLFNVPIENIHKEHFTDEHHKTDIIEIESENTIKQQDVILKYEGKDYKINVKPHETILEAALNQDIDLPYSCQAGMCTACMGKCIAGKVTMDEEDGLTDNEVKQGYVLTCVSHPASDGVIIEIE